MQIDLTEKEISIIGNLLIAELIILEHVKKEFLVKELAFSNELRIEQLNKLLDKLKQVTENEN